MAEKRIVIVKETTRDRIVRNLATVLVNECCKQIAGSRQLTQSDAPDIARRTVNEWLKDYRVERRK